MSAISHLPRRLVAGLATLALSAGVAVAVVLGAWQGLTFVSSDAFSIYTAILGTGCCLTTAVVRRGSVRLAWCLFALMMGMYGVGDTLWLIYGGAEGSPPILSAADAMYMGAVVPATIGIVVYPVVRGARGMWRPLTLDAIVLSGAVLFIDHTLVLNHVYESSGSALEAFMLTVYPITDVLLACLLLLLMIRSSGHPRPDVMLLGVTFFLYIAADNGYALLSLRGVDTLGTVVDLGYTLAPLTLAAAAIVAATMPTPRRTLRNSQTGVLSPLLPDLAALLALALAAVLDPHGIATAVVGVGVLTSIGVRQVVMTAAGEGLRGELERRVAERTEELAEVTEHYRRLDGLKYEFVTAVSHELRTPLTAIRGSLEMLHDGDAGELPPTAQSVVAIATRGSERLSRLVNDIIDLERLQSGAFGFAPAMHSVAALLDEAAWSLGPLAAERHVEIFVQGAEGESWCDPDRVLQVLINLLGNALKFSPPHSVVTVEARLSGEDIVFSVRDKGRGIPESELEAVFDRFYQVEMGDSRQQGGAGLGLTICQHIVRRHNGRIWAESTGSQGATFWFTLPAQEPRPDDAKPKDPRRLRVFRGVQDQK